MASFALAAGAIAWIVSRIAETLWPAAAAAFVFVVNPNLLYLQSTPMTEPLMLGLTLAAVAMLVEWCVATDPDLIAASGRSGPPDRHRVRARLSDPL